MKKYLMTLVAVLCCAMTTVVFTACSSNEDNPTFPSVDVNKGVVINLGSIVIKPYLQFGASLADVEKYMKENYPDWTDMNPDALNEYQQQGGGDLEENLHKGQRNHQVPFRKRLRWQSASCFLRFQFAHFTSSSKGRIRA